MERLGKTLEKSQTFVLSNTVAQRSLIYLKIEKGINYIHYKQLCHNDIKPDNILQALGDKKLFKIIDLGIVCKIGSVCFTGFTPFAAPEKFIDQKWWPEVSTLVNHLSTYGRSL